ncbi:MAG TPA: hypothetical protein VII98_03365 [Solirubrobacteraceae bacterium]
MSTSQTPTLRRHDGETVVLRPAHQGDAEALRRLAIIDSAEPLDGDVLVAERDGVILAAHEMHGPRVIADPFAPTADLVDLLQARIALLRRAGVRRRARFARRRTHPLAAR